MMPPLAATTLHTAAFEANVAALARRQPALAERLRAVEPPGGARIVAGRDGCPVVVLEETAECVSWLGGSSMPSISAPATLAEFQDRGGNVALASVGTGHEAQYLAKRLAAYRAVFVCEPNTVHLALALAAVELADLLDAGRLVLVDGDIEATLFDFLVAHPGYTCPAQIFVPPGMGPVDTSARTSAVERAAGRAEAARRQCFEEHKTRAPRGAGTPESPAVLLLSLDPIGGAVAQAELLANACAKLNWPVATCVPDAPERCSRFARLAALRDGDYDLVLFLNCAPGALAAELAPHCASAAWFFDSPVLPADAFDGLADCARVFAASTAARDRLVARGAPAAAISVVEAGVDDTVFCPRPTPEDAAAGEARIAVLCDVADVSAKASGIGLESHERLWTKAADLLARAAHRGGPINVEELLRTAERQAVAPLSDEDMRKNLVGLVAGRLVKTVVARTVVEKLSGGAGVELWGAGWSAHPSVRPVHRGPLPDAAERNRIYHEAALVVLPFTDAAALRHAGEALAAGSCPLLRRPDAQLLACYPQTGAILAGVPTFSGTSDLQAIVRKLLKDAAGRQKLVADLRSRLLAGHTVTHRLRAVYELLSAPRA